MKKRIVLAVVVVSVMLQGTTLADVEPIVKSLSNPQSPPPPIVQNAGDPPGPIKVCGNC